MSLNGNRPRLRAGVSIVDIDGEAVVYDIPSGGQIHYLNHSAALVLDLCDGTSTIGEMARAIAEVYEMPAEEVEKQVRETVENLEAVGLLLPDGEDDPGELPDDDLDQRRLVRMEVPRTS
jgi:PqqD family protein of HPr-rel-A system